MSASVAKLARVEAQLGELIEKRTRRKAGRVNFAKYRDDPVGFIRAILKAEPWDKQEEIARSLLDSPLVAVQSANGVGKDWIAAALALWWVYARRGLVLITGPSERQVHEIIMRTEIARFHARAGLPGELYTGALRLPEDVAFDRVGILAQTSSGADGASKLTGHHAPRILILITEAQGVESFAWEGLLSCAVGAEDRVLAIGNPVAPVGMFFTITRPSSPWRTFTVSAFDHPNVAQDDPTLIPGGVTRAFIERVRQNFGGVASPSYIARVLGQFPETSLTSLVSRAWLEAAVRRYESGEFEEQARASGWTAGVDVARHGDDSSCLALRRGPVLRSVETWHGADTMLTTGRVIEALRKRRLAPRAAEWNPFYASGPDNPHPMDAGLMDPDVTIIVDATGLGSGVYDRLVEQGWSASEHWSAGAPRDKERFKNRRAEVFWTFREVLENGTIALPRDEELFEELLAHQWKPDSAGRIQIEAKDELRARLGRSPDRADAVTMAFGAADVTSGGGDMIDF